jgi:hypothetical protein
MENLKYIKIEFLVPDNFDKDDLLALIESGVRQGYRVWDSSLEGYYKLQAPCYKNVWDSIIPIIEIKLKTEEDGSYFKGV